MEPRIYTYKTTFEEIPDWYWGAHKEEKFDDGYLGSPETHAWKWSFYTPHLQICELFPYTDEGWVQARKVEDSCIRYDLNNPLCLNENVGGSFSLEASRRGAKKVHEEKDESGTSLHALKMLEIQHKEKDIYGMSLHGVEKCGSPRKAVVVTFPGGSKQQFKSMSEAARFLCVNESVVRKRIQKDPSWPRNSKLLGLRFELV